MAPLLDNLAKRYRTDPWTVWSSWDLGRFDFNRSVMIAAAAHQAWLERQQEAKEQGRRRQGR